MINLQGAMHSIQNIIVLIISDFGCAGQEYCFRLFVWKIRYILHIITYWNLIDITNFNYEKIDQK